MFLITNPSARSTRKPTSFLEPAPLGPPLPAFVFPVSTVTSVGFGPDPSIWRLQRMHGPRSDFGMPLRLGCGGGGAPAPSARPATKTRLWSLGQWNW